jgi:type IV pilus assembly protein PilW
VRSRIPFHSRGFSLIEIMLGLTIGMLGMVVMMQVYLSSQASQRSTSGTGDAQTNGSMALMSLQRELRQAGFGITALPLSGCNIFLRTGVTLTGLAPLSINHAAIPAGDAGSDTLLLLSGSAGGSPEGDLILQQPATNRYVVTTPTSFQVGDWVIVTAMARPTTCDLRLESIEAMDLVNSSFSVGTGTPVGTGTAFNLGATPSLLAYVVRQGRLTVCNYLLVDCADQTLINDTTVWTPFAADIVALRAQYGRNANLGVMSGQRDTWDQITPGSANDVSGFSIQCSIARVLAARIAIVARNGQLEKSIVTLQAPVWEGSADAPFDLSLTSNWDHYRYRVFQSLVPLRNVLTLGVQSGC